MLRNDDLESCLLKFVEPARSQFFEGIKASRHLASKSVCQELSRSAQQSIPTVPCTGRGYVASLSEWIHSCPLSFLRYPVCTRSHDVHNAGETSSTSKALFYFALSRMPPPCIQLYIYNCTFCISFCDMFKQKIGLSTWKQHSGWHHRLSQVRSTQHICACSQSTLDGASKLFKFSTRIQVKITKRLKHSLIKMLKTGGSKMHHARIFVSQNFWGTDFSFNGALRTGAFEQYQWTQDLRLRGLTISRWNVLKLHVILMQGVFEDCAVWMIHWSNKAWPRALVWDFNWVWKPILRETRPPPAWHWPSQSHSFAGDHESNPAKLYSVENRMRALALQLSILLQLRICLAKNWMNSSPLTESLKVTQVPSPVHWHVSSQHHWSWSFQRGRATGSPPHKNTVTVLVCFSNKLAEISRGLVPVLHLETATLWNC